MTKLAYADLGLIGYSKCLSLQRKLEKLRFENEIPDTLLLLEHTPVITLGTAGGESGLLVEPEAIQEAGVQLFHTDRGGNVTYHGPGQLVGYPIFDLHAHGKDVHLYLRNLEEVVIRTLAELGVKGERMSGLTGVWVGGEKICSIGIAVRRWISYHGLALNVSPNFEHWSLIQPCGLADRQVTSIEKLIGQNPGMDEVKALVVEKFAEVFSMDPERTELDLNTARAG